MSDAIARELALEVSAVRKIAEGDYSSERYRGSVLSRRFMLRYVVQMMDRESNQVRYSMFDNERAAVADAVAGLATPDVDEAAIVDGITSALVGGLAVTLTGTVGGAA